MNKNWKNCVNQVMGTARISDLNQYISKISISNNSPIDDFYKKSDELLRTANPDFLKKNSEIGPLLMIGLISTTENYFRNLFSKIIQLCPISKKHSANQSIMLGSVIWFGNSCVEKGAFEHMSFSDVNNIRKTCKKFLNFEIKQGSNTEPVLKEFEKICELRHSIAHCDSFIAGRNAIKLGFVNTSLDIKIKAGYKELQECGLICNTLVATFNNELFEEMVKRWVIEWPKMTTWDKKIELKLFKDLWFLFYSKIDEEMNEISNPLTLVKCKNLIKKEYNQ